MIIDDIACKITERWIGRNVIQEEDQSLYVYGIKYGLTQTIHLMAIGIIGLLWGMFAEVVVLMVAYIPLRVYAGGYHAESASKCFIYSIVVLNIQMMIFKYADIQHLLWILGISSAIVLWLSPVESPNHTLNKFEKKRHKQTASILVIIEALFVIELYYGLCSYQFCEVITMAIFTCSVLLVMGKIKSPVKV